MQEPMQNILFKYLLLWECNAESKRCTAPAEFLNATALCISLKSFPSFEIIVDYRIIFEVFS